MKDVCLKCFKSRYSIFPNVTTSNPVSSICEDCGSMAAYSVIVRDSQVLNMNTNSPLVIEGGDTMPKQSSGGWEDLSGNALSWKNLKPKDIVQGKILETPKGKYFTDFILEGATLNGKEQGESVRLFGNTFTEQRAASLKPGTTVRFIYNGMMKQKSGRKAHSVSIQVKK